MDKELQDFINAKTEENRKQFEEEKIKYLITNGFFKRVNRDIDGDKIAKGYRYKKFDKEINQYVYYQEPPITITDEEYELLLEITKKEDTTNNNSKSKSGTATLLSIIGVVVLFGGFCIGNGFISNQFELSLIVWSSALISSSFFFALSKIINVLCEISDKIK